MLSNQVQQYIGKRLSPLHLVVSENQIRRTILREYHFEIMFLCAQQTCKQRSYSVHIRFASISVFGRGKLEYLVGVCVTISQFRLDDQSIPKPCPSITFQEIRLQRNSSAREEMFQLLFLTRRACKLIRLNVIKGDLQELMGRFDSERP